VSEQTITLGADVNNDGKIGIAEVMYILQSLAGLRSGAATGSSASRVFLSSGGSLKNMGTPYWFSYFPPQEIRSTTVGLD
jgi:hypothetical protein